MNYHILYYPDTPIDCYPWRFYERPGGRTGTMDEERFDLLRKDISVWGLKHPLIVEYYTMEGHRQQDLYVRVGHNRAEACQQVGRFVGPVLFVVPEGVLNRLPDGIRRELAQDKTLVSELRKLWTDIDGWPSDAWKDSGLLLTLTREAMK